MARALVKDASLLLLDEPLANLDYKLREELRTEMRHIFRDRPAVIVYATTEPTEALLLGGRTAVLHEGRLLQVGPTLEVYQSPATERVGQVFSDPQMNLWEVEVSGTEARLSPEVALPLGGHLRRLAPGKYRLGLRAHHLRLAPESATDVRLPARGGGGGGERLGDAGARDARAALASPRRWRAFTGTRSARGWSSSSRLRGCSRSSPEGRLVAAASRVPPRRPRMARIELRGVAHSYVPAPASDKD